MNHQALFRQTNFVVVGPVDQRYENGWDHYVWDATIEFKNRQFTCEYKTGMGIDGEPTKQDVFNSLALDCSGADESFSEWAENYGLSDDSIKALSTYNQCQSHAKKLANVFGKHYQLFVDTDWDEEELEDE